MKKWLLFFFFSISALLHLSAQQLYFNHLSVNNGLSQGVNNCIYRDSRGFVWISSFDGLNRFDGVSCISFRESPLEEKGLKGTLFLNILEDKASNLWIGSNAGLNLYNRQLDKFINYKIESRSNDDQFYSPFYIDDKNKVWLQSGADIIIFNPADESFYFPPHNFAAGNLIAKPWPLALFQPLQKIYAINNHSTLLWEGDVQGTTISWNSMPLTFPAKRVNAMIETTGGELFFGTETGIFRSTLPFQKINKIVYQHYPIQDVSALHLDQDGNLWAGTLQNGLYKIDTFTGNSSQQYISSVYNSYSLSGNQVQYVYTDQKANLWVSIWGKGVDFTSLNKFRFSHHVSKEEAVQANADNFIRSIIQVKDEFWCGTQSGGILILDENKKIKTSIKKGLPLSIEHLYIDQLQQVWAATLEGLFLINPLSKKIEKMPNNPNGFGVASNQYNYITGITNNQYLVSTNAGLFLLSKKQDQYQFTLLKGITAKDVYLTTYIDQQQLLYVSRAFKGFTVCTLENDSLKVLKDVPMQASIKCFYETDSSIWIGSTIGLIHFSKKKRSILKYFTTKQGLSNQYIYGVLADENYLWISTNAGINRLTISNNQVKYYSTGDGLQSNEFNTYSFLRSSKGEFLFGGVNGLNSFFPAQLKNKASPPQLILTGIQLNDTLYKPSINQSEIKDLNLSFRQNTVSFQFTVIHYANAPANTLSYTLEGYDKSWVSIPNKSLIRYANLPFGDYTLKVKAINSDGIVAETLYQLPIHISTPWWQTIWFRLLITIAALGIIFLIIRNYIQRKLDKQKAELDKQQAVERERNRISRDMHDDLGSGLTKIAILSEVVKKQLSVPEKAKEQLDKIAIFSRELVDNLQDIIWVLNPKNDTLENLSSYIREYGLKYFEPLAVEIEFIYPEQFIGTRLSEERRRNIYLTVKESFNNIAKHAWCNHVIVRITELETRFQLQITDDGKGFDAKTVRPFANGLLNMQNRIEQVGGQFNIVSEPGKGTITTIHFTK